MTNRQSSSPAAHAAPHFDPAQDAPQFDTATMFGVAVYQDWIRRARAGKLHAAPGQLDRWIEYVRILKEQENRNV